MPTFDSTDRFKAEWARLSPQQRALFHEARRALAKALAANERPPPRLGVKRFRGQPGVLELRWDRDGRALWMHGPEVEGKSGPNILWLRVGSHDIYR